MIALKKLLTRGPDRGPVDVVLAALAVALLGFGVVMFTFFGVTYLLPGLHAYA